MNGQGKSLRRSTQHRIIGGVCGGIADWLGWNATTVRILYFLVSVLSAAFPGILAYLILWIVMPQGDDWLSQQQNSLSSTPRTQ